MAKSPSQQLIGILLVFCATLGFASQGIIIKFAFAEHASILAILLLRKLIFLPFYRVFTHFTLSGRNLEPLSTKTKLYAMLAGVFGYYFAPYCSLNALSHIDAGVERILLYCFPAIVILIQAVIDRRFPPLSYILVFALMQYGIFLTVESLHFTHEGIIGALWSLGGALTFAVYITFNHALVGKMGSTRFVLYSLYGATLGVLCHFIIAEPISSLELSSHAWLYIAFFALFSTFVPIYFFSEGVKRIGSSRASLISMACPAITVVFAYIFLNEVLEPTQLIGGMVILSAIFFLESKMMFRRKANV